MSKHVDANRDGVISRPNFDLVCVQKSWPSWILIIMLILDQYKSKDKQDMATLRFFLREFYEKLNSSWREYSIKLHKR